MREIYDKLRAIVKDSEAVNKGCIVHITNDAVIASTKDNVRLRIYNTDSDDVKKWKGYAVSNYVYDYMSYDEFKKYCLTNS